MDITRTNAIIAEDSIGSEVPCSLVTGSAGTGKTWTIRQRLAADPDYAQLCATTGIAAINLGTITVNSAFGYYDTDSLTENFVSG